MSAAWLPRGMLGRLALVLVVAIAVEFAGMALVHALSDRSLMSDARSQRVARQLAEVVQTAEAAPPARRPELMRGLRGDGMSFNWVANTVITDASELRPALGEMQERFRTAAPSLEGRDIRMNLLSSDGGRTSDLFGALRLDDGSFVTFRITPFLGAPLSFAANALLNVAVVGAIFLLALAMTWALVKPLRRLADAADRTGPAARVDIPVEGPAEVQRVATAMAAMQDRLLAMVEDRTHALVAVSHDLRTPIQRLRLRASLLDDSEAADAMGADLDDLERFVSSVLAFMRGDEDEVPRLADIAAIAMSVVDNAADLGGNVTYEGPDSLVALTRPVALKRALGNLVDNSLAYARTIRIGLVPGDGWLDLVVDDDGPGIPADQRDHALLPFQRLEGAREGAGSAGLGLAIVDRIARLLSGRLILEDSDMGGLAARLRLPAGDGHA